MFYLQKFMNDPYTATYAGFSKVTRFLHKALIQPDNNPNVPPDPETMAELLHDDELNGMKINNMEEPGYEMVTTVSGLSIYLSCVYVSVCLSVFVCLSVSLCLCVCLSLSLSMLL